MSTQRLPSFWIFFWISLLLSLAGWGGLVYLVMETVPYLGPRWFFFFCLMLALSGLALPVMYFLNRRFPSEPQVDSSVVLREAMWVGIYGCALAWLQLGRVLNPGLVVVLAAGLLMVELLLRLRERSQWSPNQLSPKEAEEEQPSAEKGGAAAVASTVGAAGINESAATPKPDEVLEDFSEQVITEDEEEEAFEDD